MTEIDRTDARILALLQKNARLSNKELAARIGLAPSSCLERVRRLVERGVITGFHAEVAAAHVGVGLQAIISVRLARHSRDMVRSFRTHVLTIPEVRAIYHIAGVTDFMIHVAVRDADHLRDLALTAFTTRREVDHIETSLIFEYQRVAEMPLYVRG
jgi:DNA-binding Lrp family transcriptional regulator